MTNTFGKEREATIFVSLLILLHILQTYSTEINVISDLQLLTEGDTLVSPDRTFELGFFKPNDTENRYVGIWYKKISVQTVVWVANRDRPLTGASLGVVKIVNPGNLVVIMNDTNHVMWSSNTTSSNTIAKLLDNGNLVVTDGNNDKILWMSFDYPTDTLLPGMKLGKNFVTGQEWYLSSWKNSKDPAPGEFTWFIDTRYYPQNILKQGAVIKVRDGPFNGVQFSGNQLSKNSVITYNMVINKTEVTYTHKLKDNSVISRSIVSSSGKYERSVWVEDGKTWGVRLAFPRDICDTYNVCGAFGYCIVMGVQTCLCLDEKKFIPRNPDKWEIGNWQDGCVRRTPLDCKNGSDGFRRYANVKLPDTQTSWFNMTMTLKECETICIHNCTCMAYANTDIRGEGSGCLLWFNELIDIKLVSEGMGGQDIFIRMASSDLDKGGTNIKIILIVVFLAIIVSGLSCALLCYIWRKKDNAEPTGEYIGEVLKSNEEAMELPLFSFSTIEQATASFSPENKLGQGGFGPVYKGILEGVEIAVKRLSNTSTQGLDEFKNEVICISKLQHRNLVKLLGCSIEGEEKLLIYEYMPNRSLDLFIFDKIRSTLLDWTTRLHIIEGIARGLVYLHQDSRLRIIHRDLKASNILLDRDMNPKISDFGIARSFGGNENETNTERVVGTYGYMSPEYALDGLFSTKSDVYSFGVLVLEIISGKRNRRFIHSDRSNNLIGHAWTMHNEGRSMELVDTNLEEAINPSEVLRSIEVGLLCVQQSPDDRPNMSSVVRMLGNELGALQKPKQPAFFTEKDVIATSTTNYLTLTEVVAR